MRLFLSVLLTLILCPSLGFAKNLEIRSENFIITGNVSKKDGKALLRDLELFRKNVFKLLGARCALP